MGATLIPLPEPPDPLGPPPDPSTLLAAGAPIVDREGRLLAGADDLADGARPNLLAHPRLLIGLAAVLMTLGVSIVVLGWIGASQSTLVEEQIPYLISGGVLGLTLATIGALLFFTHWLTVSIKDARRHEAARRADHDELMEALKALAATSATTTQEGAVDGDAGSNRGQRPVRRAPRGS